RNGGGRKKFRPAFPRLTALIPQQKIRAGLYPPGPVVFFFPAEKVQSPALWQVGGIKKGGFRQHPQGRFFNKSYAAHGNGMR
ncbi:hypothetical protein AAY51_24020, partial [Vibrio parahaemolyticus]